MTDFTAPAVSVSVENTDVVTMLARASSDVKMGVRQLVERAAILVQREMRIEAPVAVTGDLRGSVRYTYSPAALRAEITPNIDYAHDVEFGGKPRYVSVAPGSSLRAWAEQKGINPYALRNSIAKKGTAAHPFVQPTYDKMKPIVEQEISDGIGTIIEGLQ